MYRSYFIARVTVRIKNLVAFFPSFVRRFVREAPARSTNVSCLTDFLSLQSPNVDKLCGILGEHLSIMGGVDDVTAWRFDAQ